MCSPRRLRRRELPASADRGALAGRSARSGDDAALSHRSAAAVWNLLPPGTGDPEVAVARTLKRRAGIRLHGVRSLPDSHVTTRNAIPRTTVARTIVDLAAVLPPRRLERALGQDKVLRLYDRNEIEAILAATHAKPAGGGAASALRPRRPRATRVQRSLRPARRHGDFDRCALEVGRARRRARQQRIHSSWRAQVKDRRRDAQLILAGLRPLRFAEPHLTSEAAVTVALLGDLLSDRSEISRY